MRPRMILPLRSCGRRSRTALTGTSTPMPMFPSPRELVMIAVFTPMTSPRTFSRGPAASPATALIVLSGRRAGLVEEPVEEVVGQAAAAAAEEVGEVLVPRLHRRLDVHHHRRLGLGDVAEGLGVDRSGDRRAVHRRD